MMIKTSHPKLTLLAAALAATVFSSPVLAAPVVLGANSSATAGSPPVTATPSTNSNAGYEGSYSQISDAQGDGSANAFANSYGAYAVRSMAEGKASGAAQAQLTYTLTNNSGVAQAYSMSFYVYGGSINTSLNTFNNITATLSAGESLAAQYAASVKVNGVSKFSSTASILKTDSGTTYTKTGTDLNSSDDGSDGFYSWSGDYFNIDLGTLGVGESLTVLAELDDSTLSDVGTYDFGAGGGGNGCYGGGYGLFSADSDTNATAPPLLCFKGQGSAFYGDPTEFFGSANTGSGTTQTTFSNVPVGNAVPEPASLPLIALALAGAAASTRRRKLPQA